MSTRSRRLAALGCGLALLAACGDGGPGADAGASGREVRSGVLRIDAGACTGEDATGSWFRMVQPGGTVEDGPFVANPDSACQGQVVTPLSPGADGGLRLGAYQPQPDPGFLDDGTSASSAVIAPQGFFAVRFGISTNETDPQTGTTVPAPTATVDGERIEVDHRALSVSWNGQHFNQGAPRPDGTGGPATGTYDPATGAYTLDWTTTVDGGPFSGFTGVWHLEGTLDER